MRHPDELLAKIEKLMLMRPKEPWHYEKISRLLIKSGMWDGRGSKNPKAIVYTTMHEHIRRNGIDAIFVFLKNGVFMLNNRSAEPYLPVLEKNANEIRHNRKKPDRSRFKSRMETDIEYQKRMEYLDSKPRCGNCKYLSFTNFQKLDKNEGECKKEESNRNFVSISDDPCPFYAKKTYNKYLKDRRSVYEEIVEEQGRGKKK